MDETSNQIFISFFYTFFLFLVIFSQGCLILLIFKNQTKLLKSLRIYLLNICAAQIVTIISGYLTQCRMIPNRTTVAFICGGFCNRSGRNSCFLLHLLRDASSTTTLSAILHVFYYRYQILSHKRLSQRKIIRNFLLVHILALFCAICQFVNPSNIEAIINELQQQHPNYSFETGTVFGFSNLRSLFVQTSTIVFGLMIFLNPIAAMVYRKKIWILLNEYEEYNSSRISHAKSMITGLFIQTLIPSICFVPLVVHFFISQYTGIDVIFLEYFNSFLIILPTLIDPLLSIYFVIPFRRMIFKYLSALKQCQFSIKSVSIDSRKTYSAVRVM